MTNHISPFDLDAFGPRPKAGGGRNPDAMGTTTADPFSASSNSRNPPPPSLAALSMIAGGDEGVEQEVVEGGNRVLPSLGGGGANKYRVPG